MEEELKIAHYINGVRFYLFGDSAHSLHLYLKIMFDTVGATVEQAIFNKRVSIVYVVV